MVVGRYDYVFRYTLLSKQSYAQCWLLYSVYYEVQNFFYAPNYSSQLVYIVAYLSVCHCVLSILCLAWPKDRELNLSSNPATCY